MPVLSPSSNMDVNAVEQIQIQAVDFEAAPDEGTTIPQGETVEVFRSEIGETGRLSSYDALQVGGNLGQNPKSARGKMFVNLKDTANAEVSDQVEFRLAARPKNENGRTPLTPFFSLRNLDAQDPEIRQALPPVVDGQGRPRVVQDGRVLVVEVRTAASSTEISLSNSTVEFPAIVGY